MLANGATLGYKKKGSTEDYTNLTGLKEIPELVMILKKWKIPAWPIR